MLAKFGVGAEHVHRGVESLSPGERTRLMLALFMAVGCNCLVLDEPTNHLDLPAIEQIEQAVDTFPGRCYWSATTASCCSTSAAPVPSSSATAG